MKAFVPKADHFRQVGKFLEDVIGAGGRHYANFQERNLRQIDSGGHCYVVRLSG